MQVRLLMTACMERKKSAPDEQPGGGKREELLAQARGVRGEQTLPAAGLALHEERQGIVPAEKAAM